MEPERRVVENPGLAVIVLFAVGLVSSIGVQFVFDGQVSAGRAIAFAVAFAVAYGVFALVRVRRRD